MFKPEKGEQAIAVIKKDGPFWNVHLPDMAEGVSIPWKDHSEAYAFIIGWWYANGQFEGFDIEMEE